MKTEIKMNVTVVFLREVRIGAQKYAKKCRKMKEVKDFASGITEVLAEAEAEKGWLRTESATVTFTEITTEEEKTEIKK